MEIARARSMRFAQLSPGGLLVLAQLRGAKVSTDDSVPTLIRALKRQEGLFTRLNRKRRSWIGGIVAGMMGEEESAADYQFLPPAPGLLSAQGLLVADIRYDFRQTHVEVWAKDKRAYVIFPDSGLGRALYLGWRPLSYADGAITGTGAHIGPHR